jgi:hypothetical protein
MRSLIAALLLVMSMPAVPAAAKSYLAERFDSHIRVLAGGSIEVTETVVFHFEGGSFDHVTRDIPTRRTDGIEIVSASMDGRVLPFGGRTGEVEVRRGSPVKIRWRFAPRSDTTHAFTLTYIARGVVRHEAAHDVLEWIALPTKHDYVIRTSNVVFDFAAAREGTPQVQVSRVAEHSVEPSTSRVQVVARDIRKNGWVKARVDFGAGAVLAAAPLWQQRQVRADALAPQWSIAAGVIVAAGIVLLFGLRQRYDAPPQIDSGSRTHQEPPDALRPALAGALASNGSITLQHAMATLFTLADRGVVAVEEEPRRWGQRHFTIRRLTHRSALATEEAVLLGLAFGSESTGDTAPLSKARHRVASGIRKYRDSVQDELRTMGLFSDDRHGVRRMFLGWGFGLLLLAIVAAVLAATMARTFGGWPFLVPGAIALVGIAALIGHGALTPLSNEGVRRGSEWRAYARHLKDVARDRAVLTNSTPTALLSIAVALGLSGHWSRLIKQRRASAPAWFHTITSSDDGAFPAFVAVGGAGDVSGGGGGGGAGGAAGGGGSGAG